MNILTFDVEEWFHLLDNESTKTQKEWGRYESRINRNMDIVLGLLDEINVKATFFCVGWIVEKYPMLIKCINNNGYEVGSHTYWHQLVYEQTRKQFSEDLKSSIFVIEDLLGKKVKYFRAPGFSISEKNLWAFEIIAEHGIEIDCSVFPAPRSHGGLPSYKEPVPSVIQYRSIYLKELPINYVNVFRRPVIYSGGGYFRMTPYSLIKSWTLKSKYVMSYLHPRDFDYEQPVIKDLSLMRKFKSYVGLKGAQKKLEKWLREFDFIDIKTANSIIDWNNVPIVKL